MVARKLPKIDLKGLPSLNTIGMKKLGDFRGINKLKSNLLFQPMRKSAAVVKVSPQFDEYMRKIQAEELSKRGMFLSKVQISDLILVKLRENEKEKPSIGLF